MTGSRRRTTRRPMRSSSPCARPRASWAPIAWPTPRSSRPSSRARCASGRSSRATSRRSSTRSPNDRDGAAGTVIQLAQHHRLPRRIKVVSGIRRDEAPRALRDGIRRARRLTRRSDGRVRAGVGPGFGILSRGEVSEWLMVPLSKSGVRKHRGFESRPLRHRPSSRLGRCRRWRVRALAHAPRVRSLSCSSPPWPRPPSPAVRSRATLPPGRGRLVDYGAALEMRFGATRRGFESRPLRHSPSQPRRPGVSLPGRARRGTSGALYLQSAPAGLNPLPRSPSSNAARRCDVEDRVPRSGEPRTVSGPEGSSTKRSSSGAAERPGPSRSSWWARGRSGRRRVHGISIPLALDRRTS